MKNRTLPHHQISYKI